MICGGALVVAAVLIFSLIDREIKNWLYVGLLLLSVAWQLFWAVLFGVALVTGTYVTAIPGEGVKQVASAPEFEVALYGCLNTVGLAVQVLEHYRSKRRGDSKWAAAVSHLALSGIFGFACVVEGHAHLYGTDSPYVWGNILNAREFLAAWLFRKQPLGLFSRRFDQQTHAMIASVL
jgi:hypothetical protein